MRNFGALSGTVLAVGILVSLLAAYAADRFERDRAFREAHGRAERVLGHLEERLTEYETVVRSAHSLAENIVTSGVLSMQRDISPHGHYPGLDRVRFLPEGCRDGAVPAAFPEEWAALAPAGKPRELVWRLPVFRVGVPLETPEQRRAACAGTVEARFDPERLFDYLFADPAMEGLAVREVALFRRDGGSLSLVPLYGTREGEGTLLSHDEIRFAGCDLMVELAGARPRPRGWGLWVFAGGLLLVSALYALLRAHYERRLRDAERALERYARVAALGELAAAITHELTQPLTGAIACLEAALLKAGAAGTGPEGEVSRALRHAERAATLLDDIRGQVRPLQAAVPVEPIALGSLLGKVMDLAGLDPRFRAHRLSLRPPLGELWVRASAIGLESVLLNLLRNSAEAMTWAGRVGHIEVAVEPLGSRARISVLDDGPGIAEPARLFRPFVSDKPDGLGLGLCYCRRAVETWGGSLTGGNRREGGAVFRIELEAVQAGAEMSTASGEPRGTEHISTGVR